MGQQVAKRSLAGVSRGHRHGLQSVKSASCDKSELSIEEMPEPLFCTLKEGKLFIGLGISQASPVKAIYIPLSQIKEARQTPQIHIRQFFSQGGQLDQESDQSHASIA